MIDLIARYAGYMTGIFSALVLFVRPVREWLFGQKAEREAIRCLLRAEMLSTYYKDKDDEKIRQYDKENFVLSYKAYKALKGNSFIDDINETVKKWEVIT